MHKLSKKAQNVITSVLLIVFGLALIVAPTDIFSILLRIIGGLVILVEAFRIINLVRFYSKNSQFTVILINEILIAVLGLIILINPTATIWILTRVLGVYLMATSLLRIVIYAKAPKDASVWVAIVLDALTTLAGFWLIVQPSSLSNLLGLFLGIAILVKAIAMLADTVSEKSTDKKDDYIEAEFKDKSDEG